MTSITPRIVITTASVLDDLFNNFFGQVESILFIVISGVLSLLGLIGILLIIAGAVEWGTNWGYQGSGQKKVVKGAAMIIFAFAIEGVATATLHFL